MRKNVITLLICLSFLIVTLSGDVKSQKPAAPPDDFRVIGQMSGTEVLRKLAEIGDSDDARDIAFAAVRRTKPSATMRDVLTVQDEQLNTLIALDKGVKPYLYATRAFGYVPSSDAASTTLVDVTAAGNISADTTLRGKAIKITLDHLRVFDYPGKGIHNVLFDFAGRHQAETTAEEDLHFTQTYRSPEGEGASLNGVPIFVGLKVGNEGVFFSAKTVNVSNEDDEKLLGFLDSDTFKKGLQLINGINPAVPIVTGFADGIFRQIAARHKNIPVQDIALGLDFSTSPTRAKLREGAYIVVQAPDGFDITTCQFNPSTRDFVDKATGKPIHLNYMVFSISRVTTS